MLDDLDRELFKRGHRFVRYADDVRVFVRSKRAAQRVLDSVTAVVEQRLKVKVNRDKSRVVPASVMTMLGFGFYFTKCLRGRPGLQAGEESDPCGAGQETGFRPQGERPPT
jgi:hypothetical protein